MVRVILMCTVIVLFSGFRQNEDESLKIYWKEEARLNWDDFHGKAVSSDPNKAYTYYQTTMGSKFSGDQVELTVRVYFEKNKSWVKTDGKTEKLLRHEQLHFDIGELYTRKLRKKIKETKFTLKTLNPECSKLFKEVEQKGRDVQKQYDTETKHSTLEPEQSAWEKKIGKELKELEAFKGEVVVVKI
jgi:hypothetical protein